MNQHIIKISISIVNWNTAELLRQCIQSIIDTTHDIIYEIIVADNNSSDNSVNMLKKDFPQVILIENINNRGFAAANNQILKISKGEYILFLNPDIIVLPGAIKNMFIFLKSEKKIGAIGCKLLNKDGSLQEKGFFRKYPSPLQILLFYTIIQKISLNMEFLKKKYWEDICPEKGCPVDQPPGACTMVRKTVMDEIGSMDEDFILFFEDVDMCYRIKKAGWILYYFSGATMIHYGMQSFSSWKGLDIHIRFNKSLLLFFKKHFGLKYTYLIYFIFCINEIIKDIMKILILPFYDIKRKNKRTIMESIYFLYRIFP